MFKWGETKLKVDPESYTPPYAARIRSLKPMLPGADLLLPSSAMQEGGRERMTASLSGFTNSRTEYMELHADYLNSVARIFIGPSGETMNAMIWELSPAKRINAAKFEYSLTLMEV